MDGSRAERAVAVNVYQERASWHILTRHSWTLLYQIQKVWVFPETASPTNMQYT
jgi:hypothetical protein